MDILLRLGGVITLGLSLLAGKGLDYLAHAGLPHGATAFEFLLAAASFVFASAGFALLLLGIKLLEPQPIARQWRSYD